MGGVELIAVGVIYGCSTKIICEVSIPHIVGRHRGDNRYLAGQAQAFIAEKEEGPIFSAVELGNADGAAEIASKIVHDQFWLGMRKRVAGGQDSIFKVLKYAAVELVAATLRSGG